MRLLQHRLHSSLVGVSSVIFGVAALAQTNPTPSSAATQTPSAATSQNGATTTVPAPPAPGVSGDPWGPSSSPAQPSAASGTAPLSGNAPPPVYYVEPVPESAQPQQRPPSDSGELQVRPQAPGSTPMQTLIEEPPPPPVPRHRAPRSAFWLGARGGWWVPFGDLWGACDGAGYDCETQKFSSIASSGPMFEIDVGARFGRNYNLYALWERAQLGGGDRVGDLSGRRAETDYIAIGVRLSADPDDIGMLLDLSIGTRRFRSVYSDGYELQLSRAPLESRLGIGADIRLSPGFSLSPMFTLGLGSFGKAEWATDSTVANAVPKSNDTLTHGWLTLQLGGHFDLFPSK